MKIQIIKCLQDNYSYLIIDENNQSACVVDPSESKPIIDFIDNNKIDLKYILNTHHHHDHIGGNLELKKKYNCDVIGFKDDKDRIPGIDVLIESNRFFIRHPHGRWTIMLSNRSSVPGRYLGPRIPQWMC